MPAQICVWLLKLVIGLQAATSASAGATSLDQAANTGKESGSVACDNMVSMALGVRSSALSADLLLRVANVCHGSNDLKARRDLVERAFRVADGAPDESPTEPVPVGFTDTEPATSAIASELGVDQLSLRIRALSAMADRDPRAAREWFESLRVPVISPIGCDGYKVPRLSSYYELLRRVSDTAFSAAEIESGRRDLFLARHLFPVSGMMQAFGAISFLAEARLDGRSLERLLVMLDSQLTQLESDDRSFSVSLLNEGSQNRFRQLLARCDAEHIDVRGFLDTMNQLYARHLKKARCADMATSKPLMERETAAIEQISLLTRSYLPAKSYSLDTIRPTKLVDSSAPTDLVAGSAEYETWYRALLEREPERPDRDASSYTFDRVIREVRDWKPSLNLTEQGFFQLKNLVLARLMQQAATPDQRKTAAGLYASFLANATQIQEQAPAVWLFFLKDFLAICRKPEGDQDALHQVIDKQGDLALTAYAALDRRGDHLKAAF